MIIKTQYTKEKLSKEQKETLCMISICDDTKIKNQKRKPLNISVAIDVSGSMSLPLVRTKNTTFDFNILNNNFNRAINPVETIPVKSKLDLAKESLINLVNNLADNDILSVVAFDHEAHTVFNPTKINEDNKKELNQSIARLETKGATNLHSGWLASVKFVAENYNSKYINRSIVLSDGDITSGIRDFDTIAKDVLNVSNENISTSTFGFGDDFNEDLLQVISNSGAGNSYYVDKITSFQEQLDLEFSGLMNTMGTLVRLEFKPSKNVSIVNDFNQYEKDENSYILPNIINKKDMKILFNLKYKTKSKESFKIGDIVLTYKDQQGDSITIEHKIKADLCSEKEWIDLDENEAVKVKHIMLKLAQDKEQAIAAMDAGNFRDAKTILQASASFANNFTDLDATIGEELNFLASASNADMDLEANSGIMRKSLSYSSYEGKRK